jgi:HptB-dependent secretion and biofilm anti anti-sigma factor
VSVRATTDGNSLTIFVQGRFDFGVNREFRDAYKSKSGIKLFRVDLSQTDYLDSSALGMLLLLKEYADASHGKVVLAHPQGNIRKILDIANFSRLFSIE